MVVTFSSRPWDAEMLADGGCSGKVKCQINCTRKKSLVKTVLLVFLYIKKFELYLPNNSNQIHEQDIIAKVVLTFMTKIALLLFYANCLTN